VQSAPSDHHDLADSIRQYTPQLLGVARAFADGAEEAEDLLQELWIVASREMDRRPPEAPLRAWLHTILLNIGRARWRRRRRRQQLMALWANQEEPTIGASLDISESLLRLHLWREIAALPDLQRRVLLLRIVEGMSTARTAASLNRAEGTIKASLHRALKTLRERCGSVQPNVQSSARPDGERTFTELCDGE
jgi:RNA polymerase sigma-70 factor (ECF subfamily)